MFPFLLCPQQYFDYPHVTFQGNKGNPGPVGPPGMKGDGLPGPQVKDNSHQKLRVQLNYSCVKSIRKKGL